MENDHLEHVIEETLKRIDHRKETLCRLGNLANELVWLENHMGSYLYSHHSYNFTRAERLQMAKMLQELADKLEKQVAFHNVETQIPC